MDEFGVRVRKLILEKCMVVRTLRILCPVRVVPAFVLSTGNKECIDTIIIIIILSFCVYHLIVIFNVVTEQNINSWVLPTVNKHSVIWSVVHDMMVFLKRI